MKRWIVLVAGLCLAVRALAEGPVEAQAPAISLFDSVAAVNAFLASGAKQDYSDKYPAGVALRYLEGHPKPGLAWVYSFAFKRPQRGGNISLFHYMDGEILEFHHGP